MIEIERDTHRGVREIEGRRKRQRDRDIERERTRKNKFQRNRIFLLHISVFQNFY